MVCRSRCVARRVPAYGARVAKAGMPVLSIIRAICAGLAAMMAVAVANAAPATPEPDNKLAASFNVSGLDLFAHLAGKPGNIVMSPYSAGLAMAMIFAGAGGETNAELARVLGFASSPALIAQASRKLNGVVLAARPGEDVKLTIATALYLSRLGDRVAASYQSLLSKDFGASIFGGADVAPVNDWVRQKTEGKVANLLSRLDPNSVCIVLNAIYFSSSWAQPFDARATKPETFHLANGDTVLVPMMRRRGSVRFVHDDDADAVELPYRGGRLAMLVLMPARSDGIMTAAAIAAGIARLLHASAEPIELSMPKFRSEFGADLVEPYRTMGLKLVFDAARADFSGITNSPKEADRIHISQIRHKAVIDVNEAGTQAAAATAVEFATRSIAPHARAVNIDRPFLYAVIDKGSGTILFIGRMADPIANPPI
jgi:serpin B